MAIVYEFRTPEEKGMNDQEAVSVLFVCTGNICRSPTAEGVFRAMARERGLAPFMRIDSCGTFGYHVGEPPDERSQEKAAARGYDLSDLRARKLALEDFERFDYILAMDGGHLEQLRRLRPDDARAEVIMMMHFTSGRGGGLGGGQVPDPYYGSQKGFDDVLDMIEEGCRALLDHLEPRLRRAPPTSA